MLQEAKRFFPKLLEEKIKNLLDEALPTPAKAFQLYKLCKNEDLWQKSFEDFSTHLNHFFALSPSERHKSNLDAFLERPLHHSFYEDFELNFHNAVVDQGALLKTANWAHHLLRVAYKVSKEFASEEVLTKTLHYLTHPPLFEKARDITFADFCEAWKKVSFKLFGRKYEADLQFLIGEMTWFNTQLEEKTEPREVFIPTIYLTQTEIDWVNSVQTAVELNTAVPKFPLSRGPEKPRLVDLERTIRLFQIVQTTKLPEFIKHRDNIRATLLDRCSRLLAERAR